MRFSAAVFLALPILSGTVLGQDFIGQTWSGDNCEGSSLQLICGAYCYENLPGASISIFDYGQYCEVTTWSGTNCEGSSVDLYTDVESGCVPNLPFGSVSVSCDGPCYVGYASS
jgi:hypothetical protein